MKRGIRSALGIALSVILLWWVLRDVSFREVLAQVAAADLLLLIASVVVSIAGFYLRAIRWGLLLTPVAPGAPYEPRVAATFIGFAANNLLPARVGEFARAYALSRLTAVTAPAAFGTLVVERLFDGLVLVGLLFAALAAPSFPAAPGIATGAAVVTGIIAIVALSIGFAVARPDLARIIVDRVARLLPERMRMPFIQAMRSFAAGLLVLRNIRLFLASLALSIVLWAFLATSFLFGFRAFGIDEVPFIGAVFLQSLISLAVAVPASPGFFGPFEAAARIGLGFWDVAPERAVPFAIGYHIAGFIPVTLIGIYYVWRLGLSWSDFRRSDDAIEDRQDPDTQPDSRSVPS